MSTDDDLRALAAWAHADGPSWADLVAVTTPSPDPKAWDRCPPCTTDDDIRAIVNDTIDEMQATARASAMPSWSHCEDCGSRDCRGECKP